MIKYILSSLLRKLHLIKPADRFRFYIRFVQTYGLRRQFFREFPEVALPPAHYIYETFNLQYFDFYKYSRDTAKWLVDYFSQYKTLSELAILDWGCGPGRIIRHLPDFVDDSCRFYGADYNAKYIRWCSKNIPGVTFLKNDLHPPLDFEDKSLDIIYGISIFTHLSEALHHEWFDELFRVLRPGGILFLTLHGNAFKSKLSPQDQQNFDEGYLVVKSNTKEGHRTFAAYQPPPFIKAITKSHEILTHWEGDIRNGKPQQDIWIIQKSGVSKLH
ncbi:MAG: class I SAM-dependent methyltransferase [Bacteroidales bacterium]|nr:class I SAM-dependent methyltransferase [Bacteroidales bacterium]MCF8337928.1 class I SAM-dependent methyltransferase [Bacteroidales bacterium]